MTCLVNYKPSPPENLPASYFFVVSIVTVTNHYYDDYEALRLTLRRKRRFWFSKNIVERSLCRVESDIKSIKSLTERTMRELLHEAEAKIHANQRRRTHFAQLNRYILGRHP